MNSENKIYDVVIGGQGAAAFAAGMYAARYQMSAIVVGTTFGGETATGGLIENYPGYPDIDGFELMMKFKEHAEKYDVPVIDDKLVISNANGNSRKESDIFEIAGESDQIYRGRSVILAIGRERRSLWLDHEEDWTGRGVSYCSTCDAPMHKGNTVAVVGGGDSAVKGSVLISKYADKVYLIYRKSELTRPEAANLRQLDSATNVERIFNTNVVELLGDDQKGLTGIKLDNPYQTLESLDVDGLFIEIGAVPRKELPMHLGAKVNELGEVIVDKYMNTNIPGLIAAGDLTDASGDLKQTITAAAQGSMAATTAYEHVSNL